MFLQSKSVKIILILVIFHPINFFEFLEVGKMLDNFMST